LRLIGQRLIAADWTAIKKHTEYRWLSKLRSCPSCAAVQAAQRAARPVQAARPVEFEQMYYQQQHQGLAIAA